MISKVQAGHRHPRPRACPDLVHSLVQQCWEPAATDRPGFDEIYALLATKNDAQACAGVHGVEWNDDRLAQRNEYEYTEEAAAAAAGDEYEMPTAQNMRRLSEKGAAAEDPDDYEMPSAENMRRISAVSSAPPGTGAGAAYSAPRPASSDAQARTVINAAWGHEYSVASQVGAGGGGNAHEYSVASPEDNVNDGDVAETAFAASQDGPGGAAAVSADASTNEGRKRNKGGGGGIVRGAAGGRKGSVFLGFDGAGTTA